LKRKKQGEGLLRLRKKMVKKTMMRMGIMTVEMQMMIMMIIDYYDFD
jgi:hypothetical protein